MPFYTLADLSMTATEPEAWLVMLVIADTGPLHYLVLIEHTAILLFGDVPVHACRGGTATLRLRRSERGWSPSGVVGDRARGACVHRAALRRGEREPGAS